MHDAFRNLLHLLNGWDRDLSAHIALVGQARSWSYWFARVAAHLGDSWLWGLVTVWLLRDAMRKRGEDGGVRGRIGYGWSISLVVQLITTLSIKQLIRRRRPGVATLLYGRGADEHSFPSGHAMRMGVIAVWANDLWPGWGALLWPLAALIGWARVRLGIHYVGDVLAGWLFGAAIASLVRRWGKGWGVGSGG
jgi:membrane-associated phospholipid phosphatase